MQEPDVGLDLGTLGSGPGPKAGAQLLSQPGAPALESCKVLLFNKYLLRTHCNPVTVLWVEAAAAEEGRYVPSS